MMGDSGDPRSDSKGTSEITSRFDGVLENGCTGGTPWPPLLRDPFFVRIIRRAKRVDTEAGPYIDSQASAENGK